MVNDYEKKFMCQDVDELMKEAQVQISKAQKWETLYYNMRRREL